MMKIGVERNNPGRIKASVSRFRGEVVEEDLLPLSEFNRYSEEYRQYDEYKQFASMAWGYRAMFLILHNYDQLYMLRTVQSVIHRWCSGRDLNAVSYAKVIANRLGLDVGSYIDSTNRDVMIEVVSSMSRVENGVPAVMDEVIAGWELFAEMLGE